MSNRDADAGVMVFAGSGSCPIEEPFQWFDHRALVVLDKDGLDAQALRLACLWARWTTCREGIEGADTIDATRVQSLIDSARRSLKTATTIKGSHTKAKTAIDQASGQLKGLVDELQDTLDALELEIASSE